MSSDNPTGAGLALAGPAPDAAVLAFRLLAWATVATLFVFVANAYLTFWRGWPGAPSVFEDASALSWVQAGLYIAAVSGAAWFVLATSQRDLRADGQALTGLANYLIRAAFWAVLLVGLADTVISFLRVEGLLDGFVGESLSKQLGRNQFRAPAVHLPLAAVSLIIAAYTRSLGFFWLSLLVVVAELQIVITRFIFSYEQAFMGDLVRFWYGALFLFSSAHTLVAEGHVRVDVLYAGFSQRTKGFFNALGCLLLGLPLCWVVLAIGLDQRSSIISSPMLSLEVTQSGFGMYVKYLLASFLAIFAGSMMVQFSGYLLDAVADYRGEPRQQKPSADSAH